MLAMRQLDCEIGRLRLIEQLGHDLGAEALIGQEIAAFCAAAGQGAQPQRRR